MRVAVLALVATIGCSTKSDSTPAEPPPTPPTPTTPAPPPPPAPPKPPPPTPPTDSTQKGATKLTPEDKAAQAKYRAAMTRGRKATDARRFPDAIAAFDDALAAKTGDPRALSERGFARLLAGDDYPGASQDFDDAADRTKDPKLLSMIWFNRGLVEEKRGDADNATVDFYLANQLRPTAAAKAKLAGKSVCPAHVDHGFQVGWPDARTIDAADWAALASAMPVYTDDEHPKSVADAKKLLFESGEAPTLPAIVTAGQVGSGRIVYLVVARGQALRAFPVGADGGGRCPGEVGFAIAAQQGAVVQVSGSELFEGGYTFMCRDPSGELYECDNRKDEESAGTACFGGTPTIRELAIDTASGKELVVERPRPTGNGPDTVKVTLTTAGVKLSGAACDREVAW